MCKIKVFLNQNLRNEKALASAEYILEAANHMHAHLVHT